MDSEDSRKRPADSDYGTSCVKRLCQQGSVDGSSVASPNDNPAAHPQIPSLLSIKDMLSVPLEFVFRQCPASGIQHGFPSQTQAPVITQQRPKPLLSRNEASCLIRIQCLAVEVDSLVQFSTRVLTEQVEWLTFHDELVVCNSRHLRALLPILLTMGETFTQQRLRSIQADLTEALKELELLADNLRQSSEANWATAEVLLDAVGTSAMAREKRLVGDLQDELAQRIDSLVKSTILDGADASHEDEEDKAEEDILAAESPKTMEQFCRDVWTEKDESSVSSPLRESNSQNSRLSIEPVGKENEPSQHSSQSIVVEDSPACLGAASQGAVFALSSLAYSSATPKT